jgi:hypothetical protein
VKATRYIFIHIIVSYNLYTFETLLLIRYVVKMLNFPDVRRSPEEIRQEFPALY